MQRGKPPWPLPPNAFFPFTHYTAISAQRCSSPTGARAAPQQRGQVIPAACRSTLFSIHTHTHAQIRFPFSCPLTGSLCALLSHKQANCFHIDGPAHLLLAGHCNGNCSCLTATCPLSLHELPSASTAHSPSHSLWRCSSPATQCHQQVTLMSPCLFAVPIANRLHPTRA